MGLDSTTNRNDYTGNGAVSVYAYGFKILNQSHLLVTVKDTDDVETQLTITTDYTVDGVGSSSGGNVTLVDSSQDWLDAEGDLKTGYSLSIRRVVPLTQDTDIRNQSSYYSETHEDAFDYSMMADQQQQDEIDRSVKSPETLPASAFDPSLPSGIDTANVSLIVNPTGDAFIVGPTADEISGANASAIAADASATLSEQWATKDDGIVDTTDYSSKAWAVGGTDVTDTASRGAAKEWATKTSGTVDTTEYSAKHYANAAAASASDAAAAAAASQWSDVVYVDNSDSPVSISDSDTGTLYSVDTSGGAVTFNLPAISALTLSSAWSIGIKKTTSDSNDITVNRNGTDTIDGNTSKVISRQYQGASFVPDSDGTPDDWTSLGFGEVPIDGAIVGTTDTQVLTNKTFDDEVVMKEIATPSTPASGYKAIYPKADGKLYTLNDAGEEVEVGSGGSGQGAINYIKNPNFEVNEDDVVDSGADITIGLDSSTPLRGTQSLEVTIASTASTADFFDIEMDDLAEADLGKPMFISFDVRTDANYTADDVQFVLRDFDAGEDILFYGGNSSGSGKLGAASTATKFKAVAYINNTSNSFSLRGNVLSAPSSDAVITLDNIEVGPQALIDSPIVSDWIDFTPTGTWTTNSTYTGQYRRVGDTAEIHYKVALSGGGPNSSVLRFSPPPGLTPDTLKMSLISNESAVGEGHVLNFGSARYNTFVHYTDSTGDFLVKVGDASSTYETSTNVTESVPVSFGSTDSVEVTVRVPIEEWANQSAVLSDKELLNETIKFRATLSAVQSVMSASSTVIEFDETDFDKVGGFNDVTHIYTVPKTGYYLVNAGVYYNNVTANEAISFLIQQNGSTMSGGFARAASATDNGNLKINDIKFLNKGDEIRAVIDSTADTSYEVQNAQHLTYFALAELPDLTVYSVYGEPLKTQTKFLTADITSNTTMSDLTFSKLTIGQWYKVHLQVRISTTSGSDNVNVDITHDSSTIGRASSGLNASAGVVASTENTDIEFQATATSLTFVSDSVGASSAIEGNSSKTKTWAELSEIQPKQETNAW